HRARDWEAFAAVYRRIIGRMPARKGLRQQVAAATMTGMVATLHDNHAGWSYPEAHPPPGENYGLGITTSPGEDLLQGAPGEALPPMFVTVVNASSPAASTGVRP